MLRDDGAIGAPALISRTSVQDHEVIVETVEHRIWVELRSPGFVAGPVSSGSRPIAAPAEPRDARQDHSADGPTASVGGNDGAGAGEELVHSLW
jgi:hypothetical protein